MKKVSFPVEKHYTDAKQIDKSTAVKRRVCASGYIFWQPRANLPRKTWETTSVTQNLRKKIETFIEICEMKRK